MTLTIDHLPDEIERALRERAATEQKSLDAAVIDALARGLGVASEKPTKKRDLSEIAGTWVTDPETEGALKEQNQIDPALCMRSITVQQLHALSRQQPVELIDVRTPAEFSEGRTPFARHVPMDTIDPHQLMQTRQLAADAPMYFICHVGGRSGRVCQAMTAVGFAHAVNVEGGMEAWEEAGLPVVR